MKKTAYKYRVYAAIKESSGYAFRAAGLTFIAEKRTIYGRTSWHITEARTGKAIHFQYKTLKEAIADTVNNTAKAMKPVIENDRLFKYDLNPGVYPVYDILKPIWERN